MTDLNPFDYLNSINNKKQNMMRGTENDSFAEKSYSAFIVNRGLSLFSDSIMHANQMNMCHWLDNKMQYEYFFHAIRKKDRWSKWPKKQSFDDLDIVKQYFGYNTQRAVEALKILSMDDIQKIRTIIEGVK